MLSRYVPLKSNDYWPPEPSFENTTLILVCYYFLVIGVFVFSHSAPHLKPIYTNCMYIVISVLYVTVQRDVSVINTFYIICILYPIILISWLFYRCLDWSSSFCDSTLSLHHLLQRAMVFGYFELKASPCGWL